MQSPLNTPLPHTITSSLSSFNIPSPFPTLLPPTAVRTLLPPRHNNPPWSAPYITHRRQGSHAIPPPSLTAPLSTLDLPP
ncbi:hypothetical protein E2C01_048947 [Portunus trituberculatus]|uniref:Uncharacterized protein n=1 Tax=Portunus trituberculatus TaxID=210409 RepID=A0A5B7GBW2_PORTR|nr:hypothetical protein [Portunus trituberculatus]